jgi:hypothetical protein
MLLDRESNIDSRLLDWYVANSGLQVVDYWAVEQPGRLRRSPDSGAPIREKITFSDFLRRTGVFELFEMRDSIGIEAAQSAVINPWGFVGYQFGEALLIDLGYYRPAQTDIVVDGRDLRVPSYYVSTLAPSTWRNGRTHCAHQDAASGSWLVATDVNSWQGTFTGKDGLRSFEDLRRHDCQRSILRSALRHSAEVLNGWLEQHGQNLWAMPAGGPSPAGLLAASHLCGPFAVVEYLRTGRLSADEAGTSIAAYLQEFAQVDLTSEDLVTS